MFHWFCRDSLRLQRERISKLEAACRDLDDSLAVALAAERDLKARLEKVIGERDKARDGLVAMQKGLDALKEDRDNLRCWLVTAKDSLSAMVADMQESTSAAIHVVTEINKALTGKSKDESNSGADSAEDAGACNLAEAG